MGNTLQIFFSYFWVWMPLAYLGFNSISQWLKMKEETARLGSSTESMEKAILDLHEERVGLIKRIENLEAIVTHEVWEAAKGNSIAAERIEASLLEADPLEPSDADRAAGLASRLKH